MSNDATFDIINEECERIDDDTIPYSMDIDLGFFVNVKCRKKDGSLKNDQEIRDEVRDLYIGRLQSDCFDLAEIREYPEEGY